jgi:hypothetical protein
MTLDYYTKRDAAVIVAGSIIAALLIAVITWFLIGFVASDARDPSPRPLSQEIRKQRPTSFGSLAARNVNPA